jgi:hypothetical protein
MLSILSAPSADFIKAASKITGALGGKEEAGSTPGASLAHQIHDLHGHDDFVALVEHLYEGMEHSPVGLGGGGKNGHRCEF